jgi:hypothetical protein
MRGATYSLATMTGRAIAALLRGGRERRLAMLQAIGSVPTCTD